MVMAGCQCQGLDRADFRFSRREVREHTRWRNTQMKVHLKRLEEMEYLLVHRGGRGRVIFVRSSADAKECQQRDTPPIFPAMLACSSSSHPTPTTEGLF